jgi:hypothetical protein
MQPLSKCKLYLYLVCSMNKSLMRTLCKLIGGLQKQYTPISAKSFNVLGLNAHIEIFMYT